MTTSELRFFFSLRSPYSWFATRLLRERHPEVAGRLRWIPYWEPGAAVVAELRARHRAEVVYVPMSKAKHLYILADTKRLAAEFGFDMRWPIDRDPDWDVPHFAYVRAALLGAGQPVMNALMAARWERGEDICQPDAVRRVADTVGLPAELLVGAASDEHSRASALAGLAEAYRAGVFGIPFFTAGRQRFWGVDRLDAFLAAVRGPAESGAGKPDAPPLALAAVGHYDTDAAGGCG